MSDPDYTRFRTQTLLSIAADIVRVSEPAIADELLIRADWLIDAVASGACDHCADLVAYVDDPEYAQTARRALTPPTEDSGPTKGPCT